MPRHVVVHGRLLSQEALDACRWGGLGLNAPRVLDALAEPLTAAELAERVGMNAGHLRARFLPKLRRYGVVKRASDGRWSTVPDVDAALAGAAAELGLVGRPEPHQAGCAWHLGQPAPRVQASEYPRDCPRLVLRLTASQLRALDVAARESGMPRSTFAREVLVRHLDATAGQ